MKRRLRERWVAGWSDEHAHDKAPQHQATNLCFMADPA